MKRIIFVRHGRAEDQSPLLPDLERSLTTKGKQISGQMATRLGEFFKEPCIIMSSPAFRALETAIIFARVNGWNSKGIKLADSLYFNISMNSFPYMISELDDNDDNLILFGHNPAFTEIPDRLSVSGCDFMPKTGIVSLIFNVSSWKDTIRHKGKTEFFLKPEKDR